jgi:acyl carrier protein
MINRDDTEFLKDLASILQANSTELSEEYVLNESNWDSVSVIAAIALIDKHWDVTVPTEQLGQCASVGELYQLIRVSGGPAS